MSARHVAAPFATMLVAILCALGAGRAQAAELHSIGTGIGGGGIIADGERYAAWLNDTYKLHIYDALTGETRDVILPAKRPDEDYFGPYPCRESGASHGVALIVCLERLDPQTNEPQGSVFRVELATGTVTRFTIAPNPIGFGADDLVAGVRFGRDWVATSKASPEYHGGAWNAYLELATGRVRVGHRFNDDDITPESVYERLRDVDQPDLPLRWCGPTWVGVTAMSYPYLLRDGAGETLLDRCDGHRLAERIPLGRLVTETITPRFLAGVMGASVVVFRTTDGAGLASYDRPAPCCGYGDQLALAGNRIIVAQPTSSTRTDYLASDPILEDAPPRHVEVAVTHRRIGPFRVGPVPPLITHTPWPGTRHGGLRYYRFGRALIVARGPADTPTRISTAWPRATVAGHPLALGIRRLARALPTWHRAACRRPTIVRTGRHGAPPTATLVARSDGTVAATVSSTRLRGCAAR